MSQEFPCTELHLVAAFLTPQDSRSRAHFGFNLAVPTQLEPPVTSTMAYFGQNDTNSTVEIVAIVIIALLIMVGYFYRGLMACCYDRYRIESPSTLLLRQ